MGIHHRSRLASSLVPALLGLLVAAACSDDDKGDHDHDDDHGHDDAGSGGGSGTGGSGTGGSGTGGSGTGGSGTGGVPEAGTSTFALKFRAKVGAEPFDCGSTYMGLGTTAKMMAPQDFRFYVHDVRLVAAGGAETPLALTADAKWQTGEVALVDFEDNTGSCANGTTDTNDAVIGTAAAGTYTGVVFKIGVPESLNHRNPQDRGTPSPLNLTAMAWDWTYGYKFMKLDFGVHMPMPEGGMPMDGGHSPGDAGHGDAAGGGHGAGGFFFHLGSTFCTGDPAVDGGTVTCQRSNRPEIRLDGLDLGTEAVVVDYAALVAGVDTSMNMGGAPGCMSGDTDPECPTMVSAVGVNLATGEPAAGQTVFTVGPQ